MTKLDYSKYGFNLSEEREGIMCYTTQIKDFHLNLMVANDTHTLDYVLNEDRSYVANRYKIETQEQLDFLIYNGRVGWLFKLASSFEGKLLSDGG